MAPPISLFTSTVVHQTLLERYKDHEVLAILGLIDRELIPEVEDLLLRRLERVRLRGYDRGPWTTQRYRDMLAGLREIVAEGMKAAKLKLVEDLDELAIDEGKWSKNLLSRPLGKLGFEITLPALATLRAVVAEPIFDAKLAEWFKGLTQDTVTRFERQLNRGMVLGESTDHLVRRVVGRVGRNDGAVAIARRHVETVVRTSVTQISARARELTFEENQNVVQGVEWVSTLDARTSIICASLDGKVFDIGKGPRPPAHPNCRSTVVPALKSFRELGIDRNEFARGTRASMDGPVPESATFGSWIKQQPADVQDLVLGPGRAALLRRGVVPIEKWVRWPDLHPLSLKELRELEARAISRN